MEDHSLVAPEGKDGDPPDEATILRCIKVIESRSGYLKDKGVSSWNFFFGVSNVLVVTWFFGVLPQHFWILYILESLVLFPQRYRHMAAAKPLSEVFFWFDFCWIANFSCIIILIAYVVDAHLSFRASFVLMLDKHRVRRALFCMFFGVATGPLSCAVGALGNAVVFHDADNTASCLIHLGPTLLAYTLRWHGQAVRGAWPRVFDLDYFEEVSPWGDLYLDSAAAYLLWWVFYVLWLLTCGMRLPAKGYDTVFHSMMRGSNPISGLLGWTQEDVSRRVASNDFTVGSALLYMLFHGVAVLAAIALSVGCWVSQYFHGFCCLAMTLLAIYRGSQRYSYYILGSYLSELKREFGGVLKQP